MNSVSTAKNILLFVELVIFLFCVLRLIMFLKASKKLSTYTGTNAKYFIPFFILPFVPRLNKYSDISLTLRRNAVRYFVELLIGIALLWASLYGGIELLKKI